MSFGADDPLCGLCHNYARTEFFFSFSSNGAEKRADDDGPKITFKNVSRIQSREYPHQYIVSKLSGMILERE